jgi:transcriptional regulator with XRE-family HTH domain
MNFQEFLIQLGVLIKAKRKAKGLSQVQAAKEIGVDYRHYQNIEGGKINIRVETLLLMMQFYAISFSEISPVPVPAVQA